jgi:hypothetical protein
VGSASAEPGLGIGLAAQGASDVTRHSRTTLRVGPNVMSRRREDTRGSRRACCAAFVLALTAAAVAGCDGGGESSGGTTRGPASRPASTTAAPTVSMTIADGAILARAVPWRVMAQPAAGDSVSEVDFLVDGQRVWAENSPPYVFDDDDQLLPPWLLGSGDHVLTAHVQTVNGAAADATAHVTVKARLAANNRLVGTYRRVVTRADQQRVKPYRLPSKGAFGETSPTGRWTLHIKNAGEIVGVDPSGDTANPFVEPFSVNGSTMTLYGPAVWRQPNPQSPNLFCEPETPSDYMWSLSGSTLTIRNKQQACADRDIVLVGKWVKSS